MVKAVTKSGRPVQQLLVMQYMQQPDRLGCDAFWKGVAEVLTLGEAELKARLPGCLPPETLNKMTDAWLRVC